MGHPVYYLIARYYHPAHGVFLSLDPDPGDADDILTQNGYAYANNNPVMLVDPDGHWVWLAINAGFAVYDGYKSYKSGKGWKGVAATVAMGVIDKSACHVSICTFHKACSACGGKSCPMRHSHSGNRRGRRSNDCPCSCGVKQHPACTNGNGACRFHHTCDCCYRMSKCFNRTTSRFNSSV
ncbi:hypothetical protein AF2641_04710 [Anoxybacillus flavithermus]|nr:hypothetical protein AF2641_04710 [Anoxybacillus flavithermus]